MKPSRHRAGVWQLTVFRSVSFAVILAALFSISTAPASAITFTLIGDGTTQEMRWRSETSPGPSGPCAVQSSGQTWSTNGRILSDPRGSLDWTGQGALQVVTYFPMWFQLSAPSVCRDSWVAVDARATPLVFQMVADPGDPDPAYLHVTVKLVGTLDQRAGIGGNPGSLSVDFRAMVKVSVDGQPVASDTLITVHTTSNGQTEIWSPTFPKGAANEVVVPVATGSLVEVNAWAYRRFQSSDYVSLYGSSPFGDGVAMVITVQPMTALAVADENRVDGLMLGVRPNPSLSPRIHYTLPQSSHVRLAIYDVAGARVATVADRFEPAGRGEVAWDGRATNGERLGAGVYVVELVAGSQRRVGKLVLLGR